MWLTIWRITKMISGVGTGMCEVGSFQFSPTSPSWIFPLSDSVGHLAVCFSVLIHRRGNSCWLLVTVLLSGKDSFHVLGLSYLPVAWFLDFASQSVGCFIFLIEVSVHGQLAPLLWVPWQRTEWREDIVEEEHKIVPALIQVSFLCVLSNPPSVLLGSYLRSLSYPVIKSGFIILLHCINFELIFVYAMK